MVKVGQYWKYTNTKHSWNWLLSIKLRYIDPTNGFGYFDFKGEEIPCINIIPLCTKDGKKFPFHFNEWQLTGTPCVKCQEYCFQSCKK